MSEENKESEKIAKVPEDNLSPNENQKVAEAPKTDNTNPNENQKTESPKIDNTNPNENQTITIKKSTYANMLKAVVVTIAIAAFLGGYLTGSMDSSGSITSEEIKAALAEVEARQPSPQPAQQTAQPTGPQIFQVSLDDDPMKGDPDAPVTIIEFSDFQCPFCSRFYQQTLPQLEEIYIETGKVKFVYRDMPLDSLHPNARPTHIAAECADEQGGFWDYHDLLFENQGQWQRLSSSELSSTLVEYASDLRLDTASFESCLSSQEIADEVNKDTLDARKNGATGTPTFFIGNEKDGFEKLVGAQPFSAFQLTIDNLLK